MSNRHPFTVLLLILLFASAACGGGQSGEATPSSVPPTAQPPTAAAVQSPVATAVPPEIDSSSTAVPSPAVVLPPTPTPQTITRVNLETGEVTESLETLPPFGLDDLVLVDGVISGERLVLALKLIIGEATPAELGLSASLGEGGTGLFALASEYLADATANPDLQAEVARLLKIVVPSPHK